MRKFLSTFLEASKVDEIEAAFKAKNTGSSELPTYIPKSRFDEVSGKLTEKEGIIKNFEAEKTKAVKDATDSIVAKYKDIPEDWKAQLDKANSDKEAMKTEYEGKLAKATKEAEVSDKLYGAGVRNVKAVRALIDDTQPIDDEIQRIKTSDPYLFKGKIVKGTGKDGDGDEGGDKDLSTARMYAAVGIPAPSAE